MSVTLQMLSEEDKFAIANKILKYHLKKEEFRIVSLKNSIAKFEETLEVKENIERLNASEEFKKLGAPGFRDLVKNLYREALEEALSEDSVDASFVRTQEENNFILKLAAHRCLRERVNLDQRSFSRDLKRFAKDSGVEVEKLKLFLLPIYKEAIERNLAQQ